MYNILKKYLKSVIPRKFLFKNELVFRYFFGLFYLGKNHECNVCHNKLRVYINLDSNDSMCPFCGSLSRNRRLWELLNKNGKLKGTLLHFSPSRSLYRNLKKVKTLEYYSTDFENEFLADYKFDITHINQPAEKFDTIICYHILEHIIDDKKAMLELYRVLKTNGTIFIQTPFKDGEIYEDYSIVLPEERLLHFGQEDHVRIYSIYGLKSMLENTGFKVETKTFKKSKTDLYKGLHSPETVLIVTK